MSTHSLGTRASRFRPRRRMAASSWTADAMVIAMFTFLLALGAFSPTEETAVTAMLVALGALHVLRAWSLDRRRASARPAPEGVMAPEQRGL